MKRLFILFFSIIPIVSMAQGYGNNWVISSYTPTIKIKWNPYSFDTIKNCNFAETAATISDEMGNFMFSTNGAQIINKNGDTILNSLLDNSYLDSTQVYMPMNGGFVYQGALFLPDLADSTRYNLFVRNKYIQFGAGYQQPSCLCMSVIDSKADSGRGAVVRKNIPIIQDTLSDARMTAVKHANGRDWWIITHQHDPHSHDNWDTGKYYISLLTPDTVITHQQRIGKPFYEPEAVGQITFSSLGNLFANVGYKEIDIMKFDRCSGYFSNFISDIITFGNNTTQLGVAFSPNERFIYISTYDSIIQYDLSSANVNASRVRIAHRPPANPELYDMMQLAPNGKIYVGNYGGSKHLHIINNPDEKGIACNYQEQGLAFYAVIEPPNMPNYELKALANYQYRKTNDTTVCSNGKVSFGNPAIAGASYVWRDSIGNVVSTKPQPTLVLNQSTVFYLTITDTSTFSSCNVSYDTVVVRIGNPCPAPPDSTLKIPTFITETNSYWTIINLPSFTSVKIYDELGRVIYANNDYSNDFDFRKLPSATYFYTLVLSNGEMKKGKIVYMK